ncbi:MAG: Lrp/AsnC family transcriptional regulator [Cyanothece sp. SIO2G6]|nr:Lrp/AsnC family transcriptional regulator [Cyanothece sp. SIO2G6]
MLDGIDWQILTLLQQDARLSFAEIGRQVKLSPPSVTERIRQMEEMGIILGYRATVNPKAIGLKLRVLIDLTTTPNQYPAIIQFMQACESIRSAHHVTGSASFRIEVLINSVQTLEVLVGQLSQFGHTATSLVLSSPVEKTIVNNPQM